MQVGIRELKLRLSHYIDEARRGETVVVTDRGKPVARIEGLPSTEPPAAIKHLVESGRLIYKPPSKWLPTPVPMLPGEKTSTDYVREQRR